MITKNNYLLILIVFLFLWHDWCQFLLIDHLCSFRWGDGVYRFFFCCFFFATWYISCYVSRWFTFALLWYDSLIFHFQVFFVMPIYITRWFIITLIGKNSISGFALCLKKCEDENKIRTKTYIKKKISTPHITGLMLKAIPLSSS